MRWLGDVLTMMMNVTMMENLLQKDIAEVAAATEKFYVVLLSDSGTFEVEVRRGEPILVRLFACPRVVSNT